MENITLHNFNSVKYDQLLFFTELLLDTKYTNEEFLDCLDKISKKISKINIPLSTIKEKIINCNISSFTPAQFINLYQ